MKRKFVLLIALIILLCLLSSCDGTGNKEKKKTMEEIYRTQNIAFQDMLGYSYSTKELEEYRPISMEKTNPEGKSYLTYIYLYYYRRETGKELTYEQVVEFFSQEWESDGETRLYNNGHHQEIEDHIKWKSTKEISKELSKYYEKTSNIYHEYCGENEDFIKGFLFTIPTEMVDELLKKGDNPDYEMDLLSIQERWLAEGKAVLSEDATEIEYFPQYK